MESAFNNHGKNKIPFLTQKLLTKLVMIRDNAVTIAEAPMGYGKTSAIKYYTSNSNEKFHWINVSSSSKEIFWSDFCDVFGYAGTEIEEGLRHVGYPTSDKTVAEVRSIIKKTVVSEHTYIIIDNYNAVADEFFDLLIASLTDVLPDELHFIIMAQKFNHDMLRDVITKENVLYLSKDDYIFDKSDIVGLFKANSLKISDKDAQRLYEYSGGWISAVYLQMLNFAENGRLEETGTINDLVEKTVWNKLEDLDRYYITGLSALDHFTIRESGMMMPDGYSEERAETIINELVFMRFDRHTRNYYINPVFKNYLNNEYRNLPKTEQDKITVAAGKVYENRGQMLPAYRNYHKVGAWELIYGSVPAFADLYPYINSEHREFFMTISDECPDEIKRKYLYFSLIMCLVLFIYNEKERLADSLDAIEEYVAGDDGSCDKKRAELLGTVNFVRGYTSLNNLAAMQDYYGKALECARTPLANFIRNVPFVLGSPSVLFIFHRGSGKAEEEAHTLGDMMPEYYELTHGHGKGAESLFKAEMLFLRGEFDGAETLCHKTLYMADSREQAGIMLGTLLLLARMSILDGEYEATMDRIADFHRKVRLDGTMDSVYVPIIDMCESYMYALMGNKDKISEWLTDYSKIENRMNLIAMSFANTIYSKYLYLAGEHQKFLGISGQFLGVASLFSESMAQIYTYISIGMSNMALGNREKAVKMIEEAVKIAFPDFFVMPFVENYEYIEDIFQEINFSSEYREFIKKVQSLSRKFRQGLKSINKSVNNKENYGLTARELDVARLAAARYSNKEIAEKLYIAESTVKSNLKIIFSKLDINSRSELCNFIK